MTTYYKGTLFLNSELNNSWRDIGHSYSRGSTFRCSYSWFSSGDYSELEYDDKEYFGNYFLENSSYDCSEIRNSKIIFILNKLIKQIRFYSLESTNILDVVFEKIIDKDGVVYGKELYTGLIFPLSRQNDFKNYRYNVRARIYNTEKRHELQCVVNYNIPSLSLCEVIIGSVDIANQNEVLEYKNKFSKGFGKKKRQRDFEEDIRIWYNKNVYNCEIVPKKDEVKSKKELISQSSETKIMDNIEYLLMKLKKVSNELYSKYQNEYNELLSGLTGDSLINLRPTTLLGFQSLEASIEIELFTNKHQANSILDCLNTLEKEYLNNVLTGADKQTSITFNELERISELFLKIKNRYNLLEQRNVLKKIGFLYLMEVKENIDSFLVSDLENSYFKEYLKTMLIHIDALKELGIIKSNILIDLNNDLNVASVLEIIKNIEFNVYEKEKVNELVKRLEY